MTFNNLQNFGLQTKVGIFKGWYKSLKTDSIKIIYKEKEKERRTIDLNVHIHVIYRTIIACIEISRQGVEVT